MQETETIATIATLGSHCCIFCNLTELSPNSCILGRMRELVQGRGMLAFLMLGGGLHLSCASAPSEASAPLQNETQDNESSASQGSSSDEVSDEEAALLEQIEESAVAADTEAESGSDEETREVVYRVSPEGMKITIDGAEFTPRAEAVKVRGGWGVRLTVAATATEKRVLFSPSRGPMAFGGIVTRKGEDEKFGDKREGGAEVELTPEDSISFSRTWPGPDEKPLQPGDQLELHVMLWGYGPDSESRRPVAKFLLVKMAADKQGASPLIQPPGQ